MHILVTGASGLVGSALVPFLVARGHRVSPLRRMPSPNPAGPTWNPSAATIDLAPAGPIDAVVHLAGESIAQCWTDAAKQRICESRVNATRLLGEALAQLPQPSQTLVCASAIGFYGDRGEERLDEESSPGTGYLARLCRNWEAAATTTAGSRGIRIVPLRFGIVLASQGGALAKMLPPFRLGLGGRLGDGRNYWSWIALEDVINAIHHALVTPSLNGPVNAVAPHAVTNREFTTILGRVLRRPTVLPIPRLAIELIFGEMGREAMLASTRVIPAKLLASGFSFQFPTLESALRQISGRGAMA